jgi:hypothetical protein
MLVANTRGALYRGTATDELGDTVDGTDPFPVSGATDFPMSIIETDREDLDPSTGEWRSVRIIKIRVPGHIPVQAGDRIRDRNAPSFTFYPVQGVKTTRRGLSGRSSVTITVRRTAS